MKGKIKNKIGHKCSVPLAQAVLWRCESSPEILRMEPQPEMAYVVAQTWFDARRKAATLLGCEPGEVTCVIWRGQAQ